MKLLLDTHIWLWLALEPAKLHARVLAAVTDPENEILLSPVSVWEAIVHGEKGRLTLNEPYPGWIERAARRPPIREVALTSRIIHELNVFKLGQAEPADRFLVATARVHGLTLATADKRLLKARACDLLSNR
jgi:PIN domain nuclease of toxin-antitoxin system